MNKQDLSIFSLFSVFIIPGLGLLITLLSPEFSFIYDSSTVWYTSKVFITTITILCLIVGTLSIIFIKTKKYNTSITIEDIRIKNDKKRISEFVYMKMIDINLNEKYNKEHIDNWIDSNYDEIMNNFNNKYH